MIFLKRENGYLWLMMKDYPPEYWNRSYRTGQLGWDIGYVSTPLKDYFDQLTDQSIRILVPGAGNGWEVEYLHNLGFRNSYLLDFSPLAIESFKKRFTGFPNSHIYNEDFFKHRGQYDLIVELAFFSSLPKTRREDYVNQMYRLLKAGGKYVGLLLIMSFRLTTLRLEVLRKSTKNCLKRNLSLSILIQPIIPLNHVRVESSFFY